ncbi:MAG: cytochrome c family protein [Hyphomicrobiaceae bacterium]|nr:cytochrome c family protein [Hyphomicrobiaceae bacterium]
MDGFEFNKIAGAVLSAMLVMTAGSTALDIALSRHGHEKPGWELPVTEAKHTPAGQAEPAFNAAAILSLLPKANADAGADTFKKCMACHTPNKGDRNLVGPNLWGIVGRKVATAPGFAYSEAMKSHGGEWSWDRLAKYLHKPADEVPGNKMLFPGVADNTDLADLLAYLRKLSDNPAALPK